MDHESGNTGGDGGGSADASEHRPPARSMSVRELEDLLRGHDSAGDPRSERFQSALILLASAIYGHNVDLLARRTGISRALVARVARRLIDNGVWQAGRIAASWTVSDGPGEAFWNDVSVAEGRMCRRATPEGVVEWAPAGFWNKNFQFVDAEADARLSSTYHDPNRPGPVVAADEPAEPPVAGAVPADVPAAANPGPPPLRNETRPVWLDEGDVVELIGVSAATEAGTVVAGPLPADGPPEEIPAGRRLLTTVPSLDELFGNVTWIG